MDVLKPPLVSSSASSPKVSRDIDDGRRDIDDDGSSNVNVVNVVVVVGRGGRGPDIFGQRLGGGVEPRGVAPPRPLPPPPSSLSERPRGGPDSPSGGAGTVHLSDFLQERQQPPEREAGCD